MDYSLAIENTPASIPAGTGILLLHPSTGETDRIDTDFLSVDCDWNFVISTRTTAREVKQKLEYYDVPLDRAVILDTLSVERGYSRRSSDNVHYVSAPDDLDGIIEHTERFLSNHDGKRRITFDSVTELAYFAGEDEAAEAVATILNLLEEHQAIGLFHVAGEVHGDDLVAKFKAMFDAVIQLHADGTLTSDFSAVADESN